MGLRLLAGALLPLSADEAYYWLWSRHLAAGYFDHPPAIAFVIKAGTLVFAQNAFGVRLGGILLSILASVFVFDTARIVLQSEKAGWQACLFFNLSLMVTVETLVATPDTPLIPTAAAFFWALAKVAKTQDGRWWLAAGLAAGLGLQAKYSMLFLGLGALIWLIACPPQRRWLASPWPYAGGLLALLIFAPNLTWNADHGWATFAFQFGRIEGGHYTLKYLGEFLGAQALLASPFVLVLGLAGLGAMRRRDPFEALVAALLWPSIAYFLAHAMHDRVQGNWPCYLYPELAVAALFALKKTDWTGWRKPVLAWSARLAIPVAVVLLVVGYGQALLGVVPMGRKDPLARLLAVGLPEVVEKIGAFGDASAVIVTTDYASTAWFTFYSSHPVVAVGEDYRYLNATPAPKMTTALYVAEDRHDQHQRLTACFGKVEPLAMIDRNRKAITIAHYRIYRLSEPAKQACGRMP